MAFKTPEREKADKLYFRINQDIEKGQINMARAQMGRLVKMEGETARILDLKGMFATYDGNYAQAETFHKKAREIDPESERFRLNLGNLYMITEKWPQAVELFRETVKKNPGYYPGLNNLAMALFKMGSWEETFGCINEMKKIRPTNPAPYRLEALFYYKRGQYDKAFAAADKNVALDPNNPLTFTVLAQIFNAQERFDDAVAAFEKASELNPGSMDILSALAIAYGKIDRFDLAKNALEVVVKNRPGDGTAQKGLALIYKLTGDQEKFEKHAKLARKLGQQI